MYFINADLFVKCSLGLVTSYSHIYKNSYDFFNRTYMLIYIVSLDLMYLMVGDSVCMIFTLLS